MQGGQHIREVGQVPRREHQPRRADGGLHAGHPRHGKTELAKIQFATEADARRVPILKHRPDRICRCEADGRPGGSGTGAQLRHVCGVAEGRQPQGAVAEYQVYAVRLEQQGRLHMGGGHKEIGLRQRGIGPRQCSLRKEACRPVGPQFTALVPGPQGEAKACIEEHKVVGQPPALQIARPRVEREEPCARVET